MGYYLSFLAYQMQVSKAHSSTVWPIFVCITGKLLAHTQSFLPLSHWDKLDGSSNSTYTGNECFSKEINPLAGVILSTLSSYRFYIGD